MDEGKQEVHNQELVQGQVPFNYGIVNINIGSSGTTPQQLSSPMRIWNIPYRRNPFFTGRESILEELHRRLRTTNATALTQSQAVSGLGGIGKTQIAVEYAYRHRDEYHSVFWVNATSREEIIASFLELARLLDLPEKQEQDQNKTVDTVKRWLTTHNQWLLIFDNADDLALADEYIPITITGYLLLTSRNQSPGTLAGSIVIDIMDKDEGTFLILRRAKLLAQDISLEQAQPVDRTQAEHIVEAMDGLPLALDQAAAYIEETRCSLRSYLEAYQSEKADLLRRRGNMSKDHPLPVATTWKLSFDRVQQANPAAADLLRVCAFLAPDAIPEEMLITGASELGPHLAAMKDYKTQWDTAIAKLLDFSLIRRSREQQSLSIHRLVQEVLGIEMDVPTRKTWVERILRTMIITFPAATNITTWPQCERYLPHALQCAQLSDTYTLNTSETARLLNQIGYYLYERAQHEEALPLLKRALAIREQVLGPHHPDTALSLSNLAGLYKDMGKYEEALPLYQRALAIIEQEHGPEHRQTAISLSNLAGLYQSMGKYEKALPLYQHALAIIEQVLGPHHPDTAISLGNLAALYNAMGKYEEALPLLKRALTIKEQEQGPHHTQTAASLNNLAALYNDMGKYEEALPLLKRALAIFEQVLGPEHPNTAQSLNNLAEHYRRQAKYEEALPLLKRALTISELEQGPHHPQTAASLNNLASLYHNIGKYEEALPLLKRALAIFENILGSGHPSTRFVRTNYEQCLAGAKKRKISR